MGELISKFDPQQMESSVILALATAREKLLQSVINEMKTCLKPNGNQHFIISGPRGRGKSFFSRLLQITHDGSTDFSGSLFISFPEEQDNIEYVSDLLDMISVKLEGGVFQSVYARWDNTEEDWTKSKERLKNALAQLNNEHKKSHVFFSMENLQEFIPKLDDVENARLREFLSDVDRVTLIGTSTRPDMDNDYAKKLFQVFKKFVLAPWDEHDFWAFFKRVAELKGRHDLLKDDAMERRIKAISKFSGGSPRIAVILNNLIFDDDVFKTLDLLRGIVDELTPYYQELTSSIPRQSKKLFDTLIRSGENKTQSDLAQLMGRTQSTIARSFQWLVDNYYLSYSTPQKKGAKLYYVADRLYVLYYQSRQTHNDQSASLLELVTHFLADYYGKPLFTEKVKEMILNDRKEGKVFALRLMKEEGIYCKDEWGKEELISSLEGISNQESLYNDKIIELYKSENYQELVDYIEAIPNYENNKDYLEFLGFAYLIQGSEHEALAAYKKRTKFDPVYAETYYNMGISYHRQNLEEEAMAAYKKAIELDPNYVEAYNNIGNSYSVLGLEKDAIIAYEKAIQLDPNYSVAYYNMGCSYSDLRSEHKAISAYLKAIELDLNYAEAYYNMGNSYYRLDLKKEAITAFKKTIQLDPQKILPYSSLLKIYWDKKELKLFKNFLIDGVSEDILLEVLIKFYEHILDLNRTDDFQLINTVINCFLEQHKSLVHSVFMVSLQILRINNRVDVLQDLLDEYRNSPSLGDSIKSIIAAFDYLIAPDNQDINLLHPDIKILVKALLEEEWQKKMN